MALWFLVFGEMEKKGAGLLELMPCSNGQGMEESLANQKDGEESWRVEGDANPHPFPPPLSPNISKTGPNTPPSTASKP